MMRTSTRVAAGFLAVLFVAAACWGFPKPSPYRVSWELKFEHIAPRRIVLTPPGSKGPQAYWYMTYKVTNNTKEEHPFLPLFELMTHDGQLIRGDKDVPASVFDAIKERERNQFLEPSEKIIGRILVGADQAKDGVAIWPEVDPHVGKFSLFVKGLTGESELYQLLDGNYVKVEDMNKLPAEQRDKLIVLHKTLQMDYQVAGDPGPATQAEELNLEWVMR